MDAEAMLADGSTKVWISGGALRAEALDGAYPSGEPIWRGWDVFRFDVKRRDREYWRQVRCLLQWLNSYVPRKQWWRAAYKALRRAMFEALKKDWEDVLSPAIVQWANRRLSALTRDLSCVDNDRVARRGNTAQMRRYKAQLEQGCCGFLDVVETCPIDGKRYLLGCNFGH